MHIHTGRAAKKLSRRKFLMGSGAVIALPNLLNLGGAHAQAQAPERFIGLFVANGLPKALTEDMLDFRAAGLQPLGALKPFEDRMCMVRGIDCETQGPGKTPHTNGCGSFLCATDYDRVTSKGAATLDWIFKQQKANDTVLPTLNTGLWGNDDADERMRMVHSWRGVNQPNEPTAAPRALFDTIFGSNPMVPSNTTSNPASNEYIQASNRRSVLDPVLEDYKYIMSDASGMGPAVQRTISNHLDFVRDLEKKLDALKESAGPSGTSVCEIPNRPDSNRALDSNGIFPPRTQDWPAIWDIVADLYVAAYRCDLVRSGTFMVDSGGDKWGYDGDNGSTDNIHGTTLHNWRDDRHYDLAMEIFKWYYDNAGNFLSRLDSNEFLDADGGTLLDNTTVLIGTELGDPIHSLDDFTYMLVGGKNKFKQGLHNFNGRSDVDFYRTVMSGLGLTGDIGTNAHFNDQLPGVLL